MWCTCACFGTDFYNSLQLRLTLDLNNNVIDLNTYPSEEAVEVSNPHNNNNSNNNNSIATSNTKINNDNDNDDYLDTSLNFSDNDSDSNEDSTIEVREAKRHKNDHINKSDKNNNNDRRASPTMLHRNNDNNNNNDPNDSSNNNSNSNHNQRPRYWTDRSGSQELRFALLTSSPLSLCFFFLSYSLPPSSLLLSSPSPLTDIFSISFLSSVCLPTMVQE